MVGVLGGKPWSRDRAFQGEAVVTKTIEPQRWGQVCFRGSWWRARCEQNLTLKPNRWVNVVGFDAETITLWVQPEWEVRHNSVSNDL